MSKRVSFLIAIFIVFSTGMKAQSQEIDSLFNESKNTLTAVPLIINNPAMKTGFGAMGMYFFKFNKKDTISPPSTINLMGLYSTNKSYFAAITSRLFWSEDKNRASFATGVVNINNDFLYNIDDNDVGLVYTENRNNRLVIAAK